ncbi:MAG: B12-binding domain-containing radical SAM protein [Longimicrobiaceae bacterium]
MHRTLALIAPPQKGLLEGFSNGLVTLANFVEAKAPSSDVRIIDLAVSAEEEVESGIFERIGPDPGLLFVGITTTTATYQSALGVARACKRLYPSCRVVLGGHHASPQDEVILRLHYPLVDYIVRGEGELALLTLFHEYPNVRSVPGLSYLIGGALCRNPSAPLLPTEELDLLSPLHRDLTPRSVPGKFGHVTYVSARGCPLKCAFCSVANQSIRAKSVPAVVRDIQALASALRCTSIAVEDNFFAHSPKRTLELCAAMEELQRTVRFRWDCQTRVESMRRSDILAAMERAGCEAVYLGVEALQAEQLIYLGKTANPRQYLEWLHGSVIPKLLDTSVEPYVNLQLGIPNETTQQREQFIKALANLGEQAAAAGRVITVFPQLNVIYPGTRHFEDALMSGRFGSKAEDIFEDFTAWEARQEPVLHWLGDHFAHGTGGIPVGILDPSLLRTRSFRVDPDLVLGVVNQLNRMEDLRGISIFHYSAHTVGSTPQSTEAASTGQVLA